MPLFGYEGLVIVAILIVLFLWGPSKLPEMARAIGQAKREFDKAAKEVTSVVDMKSITNPITDSINKTIISSTNEHPRDQSASNNPASSRPGHNCREESGHKHPRKDEARTRNGNN